MVLSLASFLQKWMINGYSQIEESCYVNGTLYLTVDGKEKNVYCVSEKLYKTEEGIISCVSNSYQTQQTFEISNRWSIGPETLPTPHEKDPFTEQQDLTSLNDNDDSASSESFNYSNKPAIVLQTQHATRPTPNETVHRPDDIKKIACHGSGQEFDDTTTQSEHDRDTNECQIKILDQSLLPPSKDLSMCEKCGASFPDQWTLLRHKKIHLNQSRQRCKTCGKRFSNTSNFHRHKCDPKAREKVTCRFCGISFLQVRSLKKHILTHGRDEAPFKCDECGKTFSRPSVLNHHMGIHTGELPYVCAVCSRGFKNKLGLIKHEREHESTKPFVCEQCGLSFLVASRLQEHKRFRHKAEPNQLASQPYHTQLDIIRKEKVAAMLRVCPSCCKSEHVNIVLDTLKVILPKNCDTLLCSMDSSCTNSKFNVTLRVDLNSPEEILLWIEKFEESSMTTFKIRSTHRQTSKVVLFKQWRYCQHGGPKRGNGKYNITKKTGCQSSLQVLLNTPYKKRSQNKSKNPHVMTHKTTVLLKWRHNHSIEGAFAYVQP